MSHPPRKFDIAEQLMVLPVPLRFEGERIMFEQQACNGVARWADHFETLIVAAPIIPDEIAQQRKSMAWRDIETIPCIDRIEFVGLPWGRTPSTHKAALSETRQLLAQLINRSEYLHFGIGGLFGDWAGIAAQEALRLHRPYAVHMDRVEDQLVRRNARDNSIFKRLKAAIVASMMRKWHRRLISHAALSMCHGSDTFAAYRELNRNSFLVHNIHTTAEDQATDAQIAEKISRVERGEALRLCYAGRLDAEKAPLDWVRAIAACGVATLTATWLGDGALRQQAQSLANSLGVADKIHFAGFTSDRNAVLKTIRESDLFLFTHVTPESPRCLIESLISATPIIGYESHYPADLIKDHRGGVLTPMGQPEALGDAVVALDKDRLKLVELIKSAAADGKQFTSEAVFAHRAELIKKYLPRRSGVGSRVSGFGENETRSSETRDPETRNPTCMKLFVVIVNYKTADLTIDCLRSLSSEMSDDVRVVVTDNDSRDGSAEKIAEAIKTNGWSAWASIMPLANNGGFSFGNNAAIRPAIQSSDPPQYVYLLNPDTIVLPGAVSELVKFLDAHPQVGIAGGRAENQDGTVRRSVFRFHSVLGEIEGSLRVGIVSKLLNRWVVAPPVPDKPVRADWVSGASMMVRREVFETAGLLDEGYFMYFDETDFCLRAKRSGWQTWYVPASRIIHLVGQSSGVTGTKRSAKRRPKYWFDSRHRFFLQHYGPLMTLFADVAWAAGYAISSVIQKIRGKPRTDPPWLLWDFIRYNMMSWGQRL